MWLSALVEPSFRLVFISWFSLNMFFFMFTIGSLHLRFFVFKWCLNSCSRDFLAGIDDLIVKSLRAILRFSISIKRLRSLLWTSFNEKFAFTLRFESRWNISGSSWMVDASRETLEFWILVKASFCIVSGEFPFESRWRSFLEFACFSLVREDLDFCPRKNND